VLSPTPLLLPSNKQVLAEIRGTTSVTVTANNGSCCQQSSGGPFSHLPATSGPSVEERGSGYTLKYVGRAE